jgi:CheY-like chemotaxis protein
MTPGRTDPVADGDATARSKEKVLVVDDEAGVRELLRIWLEREDWTVVEAADGVECLEVIDGTFDALVLDREMPRLNGNEVYERLAETPYEGPTMICSATDPGGTIQGSDVERYITKPFTRAKFLTGFVGLFGSE